MCLAPQVSRSLGAHPSLLEGRKRPHILIVDDEISIRTMLYEFLTRLGYRVDTAPDGDEALMLFELLRQDLVVLDLRMPCMTGWELTERVRIVDPRVPVVILTGFGAHLEEVADGRGVVLVHKPVSLAALLDVIRGLLGWREGPAQPS